MSLAPRILPNYSYEDYLRWEGRWEIIDGIAYDMSPMARPDHQEIASNLSWVFTSAIKASKCSFCKVYQPIDLKISENNIVNPDLLIVCKKIEGHYLDTPPELVVEIISPSSKLKDRYTKSDLYQKFGIKYYILIDPSVRSIEVFSLNEQGEYDIRLESTSFELSDHCLIHPDLSLIWPEE